MARKCIGNCYVFGTHKKKAKRQIEQQKKLTDIQVAASKELGDYSQTLQKDMFDYTFGTQNEYNTPEAQRMRLEEAGLNPALMYGMSGVGGQSAPGQLGAGSGSAGGGTASGEAEREQAQIAKMGIGLQMQALKSQIELNESQANKNNAEADNLGAKTKTENEQREILIEKPKQEGQSAWLNNLRTIWQNEMGMKSEPTINMYGNKVYGSTSIGSHSIFNKETTQAILKMQADTGNATAQGILNSEKAKGYMTELNNAIIRADAEATKAAAIKLASEWETGEYTNWKTFVNVASQGINSVMGIITKIP